MQRGELVKAVRQAGELVVVEIQLLQRGELAQPRRPREVRQVTGAEVQLWISLAS